MIRWDDEIVDHESKIYISSALYGFRNIISVPRNYSSGVGNIENY